MSTVFIKSAAVPRTVRRRPAQAEEQSSYAQIADADQNPVLGWKSLRRLYTAVAESVSKFYVAKPIFRALPRALAP